MVCPSAERRTLRTSSAWRAADAGQSPLFVFQGRQKNFPAKNLHEFGCPLKSLCGGGVPFSHPSLGLCVFFLSFFSLDKGKNDESGTTAEVA